MRLLIDGSRLARKRFPLADKRMLRAKLNELFLYYSCQFPKEQRKIKRRIYAQVNL